MEIEVRERGPAVVQFAVESNAKTFRSCVQDFPVLL